MTQSSENIQKLQEALAYATRVGNHDLAARTRRLLTKATGETHIQHYNRRFREMLAIPADELI